MTTTDAQRQFFVDREVARLLEQAEAEACLGFCEAARRLYPGGGIRSVRVAGGAALLYGPSDPLNGVKGPGLGGPVDPREWDAAEELFKASGSAVVVDLCPLADEAFVALLMGRGYAIGSFETVMAREIGAVASLPSVPVTAGVEIREVGAGEATVWGRVLDVGFANGGEPVKFAVDIGAVRAAAPDSTMLLATVAGAPAGGAGMSVRGRVALMSGAAVLPAFRGRGVQQALTTARLRLAQERGAELAKLDVMAGSGSYRNAVRAGFQVAYTRPQLVRKWHAV